MLDFLYIYISPPVTMGGCLSSNRTVQQHNGNMESPKQVWPKEHSSSAHSASAIQMTRRSSKGSNVDWSGSMRHKEDPITHDPNGAVDVSKTPGKRRTRRKKVKPNKDEVSGFVTDTQQV